MKIKTGTVIFRVVTFIITGCIMAFAFIHSMTPAVLSSEESGAVLDFLQPIFNLLGLDKLDNNAIRKIAHFVEFTGLGISMSFCAYSFNKRKPLKYWSQMLFTGLFTAVIDEAIQLNVEGRAGMITDVLLDFSGVLTGICIMLIVFAIYRWIRKI